VRSGLVLIASRRRRAGVRRFPDGLFFQLQEASDSGNRLLPGQAQSETPANAVAAGDSNPIFLEIAGKTKRPRLIRVMGRMSISPPPSAAQ
jgi:hypothetical protein